MTKWTYQWDSEEGVYNILDNRVYHSESPYEICASQIVQCLNEARELHRTCNLLRRASEIFDRIQNCPHQTCRSCKGIFEVGGRGTQLQTEITAALEGKPDTLTNLLRETVAILDDFQGYYCEEDSCPTVDEACCKAATLLAKIKEAVK